ncbi:unnamed protein product [Ectocarpus sp. 12 AP-2014]
MLRCSTNRARGEMARRAPHVIFFLRVLMFDTQTKYQIFLIVVARCIREARSISVCFFVPLQILLVGGSGACSMQRLNGGERSGTKALKVSRAVGSGSPIFFCFFWRLENPRRSATIFFCGVFCFFLLSWRLGCLR